MSTYGSETPERYVPTHSQRYEGHKEWTHPSQVTHPESDPAQSHLVERRLRLVKIHSDVLRETDKVAIIDCYGQGTSIGRDTAYTPRIRLPAMEISKHHSNLFSMKADSGDEEEGNDRFYISDTGSTYETSHPFEISQGDLIRVGKTTFEVHIHPWPFSCSGCALGESGKGEIALHSQRAQPSAAASASSSYASGGLRRSGDRRIDAESDRKLEMKSLRDLYLKKRPDGQHTNKKTRSSNDPTRR